MIVNNFRIDTVCFARPPARCALHKFSAGSRWAEYNEAGCSGSIAAAVHARSTRDLWNSKSAPSIPQSRSRDSTVNFANALGVWFRCSQTDRRRKHRARERERERESKMRNPEIRARSCGYGAQAVVCMPTERLCIVRSRLSDGNVW